MRVVRRLGRLLLQGEVNRGVATLVFGTGMAQVIVVTTSPILTRLYSPADVGTYAVAASVLSLLVTITCLRYEYAIPLPESDVDAANALALSLLTAFATSLIAAIVLWLAGPWLLGLLGASVLTPYVLLLALGQLGGGVVATLTSWAIRTKAYSAIAATRLTQVGTLVAIQVGLGIAGLGSLGLLIGDVAGRFSGASRLGRASWRGHAESFRRVSRKGMRFAAKRYRRFPMLSSWSALLNTLGEQAPLLLLVALYGTSVGGQYALALRVGALPTTIVAGSVAQVFFAQAAGLARDQPAALLGLFWRTSRLLALTAIGPFTIMAVLAPILAGLVFGSDWIQSGLFVTILAPMYYLQFVVTSTANTLDVLERQDLPLAREILRLGLIGGAVAVASALHFSPVGTVIVLSAAGCVTYCFSGLLIWRAIVSRRPRRGPYSEG